MCLREGSYSAHGPILPIGSDVLALTPIAAFRPRRWRGALLPKRATVRFDVQEPEKRPVMADADGQSHRNVTTVEVASDPGISHRILFDPGHGLEERLISEQFNQATGRADCSAGTFPLLRIGAGTTNFPPALYLQERGNPVSSQPIKGDLL